MPQHVKLVLSHRITREQKTVAAMIRIYCAAHHQTKGALCADCADLLAYAHKRLACCPYGGRKPACSHCPVHCYEQSMRERIRGVMRYAGPRMLRRHPLMAVVHLIDTWRGQRGGFQDKPRDKSQKRP